MTGPEHNPPRGNILIVDDTPANLRLLSQILAEQGYKVRPVPSGSLAVTAAQAAAPDLILLDIRMPGMDGYETCQRLKADKATCDIPIIFISALDETQDKVKAFTMGGVDYISKPFQVEEVLARVETHLTLWHLQKQLRAANNELERQLKELQARNEELDTFAHTTAHDLKGPMGAIIGFAEMLEEEYTTMPAEKLQDYLHRIARRGRLMVNIIDELLLLAGVRKMEVQVEPLNMAGIVCATLERLDDIIEEHQAEIILPDHAAIHSNQEHIWPIALGYGPWIEEVWANYLSNAITYGGRPPRVELGGTAQADGTVLFWVRDNGPGLTPEQQATLFTPFVRLEQTRAKGYGLGLSIVRRIVEKLGGQVGVQSQGVPGQGSTFTFTLPGQKAN